METRNLFFPLVGKSDHSIHVGNTYSRSGFPDKDIIDVDLDILLQRLLKYPLRRVIDAIEEEHLIDEELGSHAEDDRFRIRLLRFIE